MEIIFFLKFFVGYLFNQIAEGKVIGKENRIPFETLLHVFFLFFLDDHLRRKVLQFFVTIIDDELLEPVNGQVLETVNVQYA